MQVMRLEMTEFMGMFTVEQGSYLYVLSVYLEKNGVKNFDWPVQASYVHQQHLISAAELQ
jgi:hypothetical protein